MSPTFLPPPSPLPHVPALTEITFVLYRCVILTRSFTPSPPSPPPSLPAKNNPVFTVHTLSVEACIPVACGCWTFCLKCISFSFLVRCAHYCLFLSGIFLIQSFIQVGQICGWPCIDTWQITHIIVIAMIVFFKAPFHVRHVQFC